MLFLFFFKFTELQACLGVEQMKKLSWRVGRKKEILKQYQQQLNGIQQIQFFEQDLEHTTPWFIDVMVECREQLQGFLKEKGVGARVMYPPINKQLCYQMPGEHPVSNQVGQKGLWLPSAAQLTDEQIHFICHSIKEFYYGK